MVIHIECDEGINVKVYESVFLENSVKTQDNMIITRGRCPSVCNMYNNVVEYDETEKSKVQIKNVQKVVRRYLHIFLWVGLMLIGFLKLLRRNTELTFKKL